MPTTSLTLTLPRPHPKQAAFIASPAKRKVIRAGRRGGKTVGVAILAVKAFLAGRRVLYATPTAEQIMRFWTEVTRALAAPLAAKVFYKNETEHVVELPGTEQRLRAKTAWNADTLRGDYADLLILDEWQLMDEDAWGVVGAPMLLDNGGDAVFVYTPPSLHSRSTSKALDKRHAAKLFTRAQADPSGKWQAFHFTSHDNPHINAGALADITGDMTALAYRQEIMAEDVEDAPGALWKSAQFEGLRVMEKPLLSRVVVAVDPSITAGGDACGIVVAGLGSDGKAYVLEDATIQASPDAWARAAVAAYHRHRADRMIAESNQGGEMVSITIGTVPGAPPVTLIHASRGKQARAEPVAALYEQGRVRHVGALPDLEDELTSWEPGTGAPSPNRLDALVYALTELMLTESASFVMRYS